jgi:histidyl-tRNA synthetase
MFGGGRYNGLAEIFGGKPFPAVGFAPGDEAMKLFLESWGMIDAILQHQQEDIYFIPMLNEAYY